MKYIIMASQFSIQKKAEIEMVKISYRILKNIVKVLDLALPLVV
jgi:hypothetical protein